VHYDAADSEGLEVGLSCGGIIDVLVAPCPIDDPVISMLDKITGDKPAVLGTVIESCPRLQHMLICEDGHTAGAMVYSSGPERLQLHARQLLKSGGYILDVNTDDPPVFLEALLPSPSLAIVGATPLAVAVCQAAQLAGFRTCIIDPREIEGNMRCTLAASNTHIVHKWPEEAFQKLNVDTSWYTAILSHDSKIDVPALRSAITRKCRYIGLLGSTRTQAQRCQTLLDEGFAPEQLECIHGPIGLSINALSFEEIAIATVAEMISVRRS
jgi:xanthine dehydrogenase accessory factor